MMSSTVTVDEVVQLARGLSPRQKLEVIERLTPDVADALDLAPVVEGAADIQAADDAYQAAYEKMPEDITDITALLPHLPLSVERWE